MITILENILVNIVKVVSRESLKPIFIQNLTASSVSPFCLSWIFSCKSVNDLSENYVYIIVKTTKKFI